MYKLENGKWFESHRGYDNDGEPFDEWIEVPMSRVSTIDLLDEWEALVNELSEKSLELTECKDEYAQKEFKIVFQSDIPFKEMYGSASEKTRKQHAKGELSDLNGQITGLEVSVDYLKHRIELLKYVVKTKNILLVSTELNGV